MANKTKLPGEKVKTNGVGLPEKQWPILDAIAQQKNVTRNTLFRVMVEAYLSEQEQIRRGEYGTDWEKNDAKTNTN